MSLLSKEEIGRIFKGIKESNTDKLIDVLSELAKIMEENETRREEAEKKLEEFNKDEKIVELEMKLMEMKKANKNKIIFTIEDEQLEKLRNWKAQHIVEKHGGSSYAGAIGGRYTYIFTPTSIGSVKTVRCSCGEEYNIEDASDW